MGGTFWVKKIGRLSRTLVCSMRNQALNFLEWTKQCTVSAMSRSFSVPVSTKIRLCQDSSKTLEFASRLEASGSSWVTLHARHVSARRRRQGPADLLQVNRLKEHLNLPIVSNGNVRCWADLEENKQRTGADGLMVGESLLSNPWYVEGMRLCIFRAE